MAIDSGIIAFCFGLPRNIYLWTPVTTVFSVHLPEIMAMVACSAPGIHCIHTYGVLVSAYSVLGTYIPDMLSLCLTHRILRTERFIPYYRNVQQLTSAEIRLSDCRIILQSSLPSNQTTATATVSEHQAE